MLDDTTPWVVGTADDGSLLLATGASESRIPLQNRVTLGVAFPPPAPVDPRVFRARVLVEGVQGAQGARYLRYEEDMNHRGPTGFVPDDVSVGCVCGASGVTRAVCCGWRVGEKQT